MGFGSFSVKSEFPLTMGANFHIHMIFHILAQLFTQFYKFTLVFFFLFFFFPGMKLAVWVDCWNDFDGWELQNMVKRILNPTQWGKTTGVGFWDLGKPLGLPISHYWLLWLLLDVEAEAISKRISQLRMSRGIWIFHIFSVEAEGLTSLVHLAPFFPWARNCGFQWGLPHVFLLEQGC